MKKRTFLNNITYFFTIFISIILILFMLGFFKYQAIAILSDSMTPIFENGDVVIYKKIEDSELKNLPQGTIIVYKLENHNIVHRIVEKIENNEETLYKTKGDVNIATDEDFVEIKQIEGVYVCHIKYIGFPSVWLHEYFEK